MTPISTNQRTVARFSLALFVLFAMVVAIAPGISFGGMLPAALQTTSSASPSDSGSTSSSPTASASSTASPSPTGPAIQFLNPSSHSLVVSNKDDGTNTTYHLVAAARALPSGPTVEFKYQQGTGNETSIGIASRVGATDTFEFAWNGSGLGDGTYTLKAILYSGAIELARDEEEIVINNEDTTLPPPPDPQAETVEITSPANATAAGFFTPKGAATAHTIIAVTSSEALDPPSLSAGAVTIYVYYTKSAPGTEPEWIECGSETADPEGIRVACTLAEGDGAPNDTPQQVTGLAAIAEGELPQDVLPGSGDAHRVLPYVQVPTSFTLSPATQTGKPAGTCSDAITATALDQSARPITGLNVDVHAKGPSDGLLFDDSGNNSSANQPPDKAHSQPETTRDCEGNAAGSTEQGQHEFAPGNPDTKHIESTATGTTEDGTFLFQLYSPDQGQSDFAIFGDVDDDDVWCAEEADAAGYVAFSQSASPSPTASSSQSPSSSSSPTTSSSASASSSTTATPTQEPTTLGPEVASCPQATPSPSDTGEANRSISLASSKAKVVSGKGIRLSGQLTSEDTSCENNEVVEITRRRHGTQQFKEFRTTATDASGAFDVQIVVRKNADYQATTPESGTCDAATSSAVSVLAKVKITIAASDKTPAQGANIDILGKLSPKHNGDEVVLQRKKGKRWVKVAKVKLDRRSTYRFTIDVGWKGRRVFRVRWAAQDNDHVTSNSRSMRVTSHA